MRIFLIISKDFTGNEESKFTDPFEGEWHLIDDHEIGNFHSLYGTHW